MLSLGLWVPAVCKSYIIDHVTVELSGKHTTGSCQPLAGFADQAIKLYNLSHLVLEARHLGGSTYRLGVPEQALGGIPLGFGIIVEDKLGQCSPQEVPLTFSSFIGSIPTFLS